MTGRAIQQQKNAYGSLSDSGLDWSEGARGIHIAELQSHLRTVEKVLAFNTQGVSSRVEVNGVLDDVTLNLLKIFKAERGDRFGITTRGHEIDQPTLNALRQFASDREALTQYERQFSHQRLATRPRSESIDSILAGRDVLTIGESSLQFPAIREQIDQRLLEHAAALEEKKLRGTISKDENLALALIDHLPEVRNESTYSSSYRKYVRLFQQLEGIRIDGKIGRETLQSALDRDRHGLGERSNEFDSDQKLKTIENLHRRFGLLAEPSSPRIYAADVDASHAELRFGVTPTQYSRAGDLGTVPFSCDLQTGELYLGPKNGGIKISDADVPKIVDTVKTGVDWAKEATLVPLGIFREANGAEKIIHVTSGFTEPDVPSPNARFYRVRIASLAELRGGVFTEEKVLAAIRRDSEIELRTEGGRIKFPLNPKTAAEFFVNGQPISCFIAKDKLSEIASLPTESRLT